MIMKYVVTAFIAVIMLVFACGYEPEPYDSTGFAAGSGGTRSGGNQGGNGNVNPTPADSGMMFPSAGFCGDAGICSSGDCCGGVCCAFSQICCAGRCMTPTTNMPSCDFSLPPMP